MLWSLPSMKPTLLGYRLVEQGGKRH
jgi:hypothetical protein